MLKCLKFLSNGFSSTVGGSQHQNPCYLWIIHPSITQSKSGNCRDAGFELLYLPSYSLDFNPIEELFAEVKGYIKKAWPTYEKGPAQGFRAFLRKCIHIVGERKESSGDHFPHAGIMVKKVRRILYSIYQCIALFTSIQIITQPVLEVIITMLEP
jgi:hypothetical protein